MQCDLAEGRSTHESHDIATDPRLRHGRNTLRGDRHHGISARTAMHRALPYREEDGENMATFIVSLCAMLALTTCSGPVCRKPQLPEVIGQILVGIVCGPTLLNVLHSSDYISLFSDLGIILMFLGGVGCDPQLLKKYSKAAIIIACMGVVFPVAVMGGVSLAFGFEPIPAAFIGMVFSATSVSISVAVLKEAGLLDSKEDVSILGAAVADDVIGAGMAPRGEMALITAQIGFNEHVLGNEYYSTIIFIISLVALVAPLLLKLTIKRIPAKA